MGKFINWIRSLFNKGNAEKQCTCVKYKAGRNISIKGDVISTPATEDKAVDGVEMNNMLNKIFD